MPSASACPAVRCTALSVNHPVFSFPPSPPSSTGMPNANLLGFWSHPGKMQTTTIPSFTIISTMIITHSPSVLFTQKIAIWTLPCTGSALLQLVTRQTGCFKIYRSLGRVSWGWGWTNHPVHTSFWQLWKTISWQRDLFFSNLTQQMKLTEWNLRNFSDQRKQPSKDQGE